MLGRCCLCGAPSYYYSPSSSPPSIPSPIPYVSSCSSGVCTDSTFAKKWTFSWSPTWWTVNASTTACVNSFYTGSFTLNQRISSIHGLPNNACMFDSDEVARRWNNAYLGISPPTCEDVPNLPKFSFLIQKTGLGSSNPGTNFVLYIRWQERHGIGSVNVYDYYRAYTANKPSGAEQNCMGDIVLSNAQYPNNPNPVISPSGTGNNSCLIQNPGSVLHYITMSPAA